MPRLRKQAANPTIEPAPGVVLTPADLILEHNRIEDFIKVQDKAYAEHMKPHKDRREEIQNQLLAMLNTAACDSFKTEHGTAYKSTLMNLKIEGREQFLDYCNENWETFGSEALHVGATKDAVKSYMDDHAGAPPPGISTSWFTRVNIRKS